ncbi:MAG: mucoidy inhibitor MuiA family protein [Hyphomicrobiaceae bacterium]
MRMLFVLLAMLMATHARADELKVDSRVGAVTVFPRGAEVQRLTKIDVPQGDHLVVLSDLPAGADMNSIRVEGKASGSLEIGAVDARRIQILRRDSEDSKSERRRIEDAIEREKDQLAAINADIETKEIQKRYIENLAGLPTAGGGSGSNQGAPQQNWTELLALIGTSLVDVQKAILAKRVEARTTQREIKDLQRKLSELAPQQVQRTEVKINVSAEAALNAELVVRYQVSRAGWTPLYDARLETGSRNVPPKLTLIRRATIAQKTGEVWTDVDVALSTARPSGRSGAPELYPVTVDFAPEAPPSPAPMARLESDQAADRSLRTARRKPAGGLMNMMSSAKEARERDAGVDNAGYQAVFRVPGRVDVPNTGDAKRVRIESISVEPSLLVRAVPKFDARAYLYAKMKLPRTVAPILRGQVVLFRDQTFVGKGRLPQLTGGEEHELGFGTDDAVRIKYSKIGETRGETGIISSSSTDQRKFKISVKNLRERPIAYAILDQRPESLNEEIKVELVGTTKPTKTNVKDRRGIVAWEGKLAPDKEQIIDFGYVVSWPADRKVRYRR